MLVWSELESSGGIDATKRIWKGGILSHRLSRQSKNDEIRLHGRKLQYCGKDPVEVPRELQAVGHDSSVGSSAATTRRVAASGRHGQGG